jgi:hypothetical protein
MWCLSLFGREVLAQFWSMWKWQISMFFQLLLLCKVGKTQYSQALQPIMPLTATAYQKQGVANMAAVVLPASGDFRKQQTISVAAENRFMLTTLSAFRFGWSASSTQNSIKLGGRFQGNGLVSHYGADAGYAMQLNKNLNLGLKTGLDAHQFKGEKVGMQLGVEGGLLLFLNDKVGWGLHVRSAHPLGTLAKTTQGYREIKTGIGLQLNEQIFVSAEYATGSNKKTSGFIAMGWMLTEKIGMVGGISNPSGSVFLGVVSKGKREQFSLGLSSHSMLGLSGMMVIDYALDGK